MPESGGAREVQQEQRDQWAQWVLCRQYGGDLSQKWRLDRPHPARDGVLGNARIAAGDVVLDVGCGDGLIAFAALAQVGDRGRVIFSDVSQALLDHARATAEQLGALDRCAFVRAPAEDLAAISDASIDVVTLRSVLIYVAAKARAFREFHRVLKPGGRLSLFEPINRFGQPEPPHRFWGYDVAPVAALAGRLRAVFDALQPPGRDPLLDFDERDLLAGAEGAGFAEVHLAYEAHVRRPPRPRDWERFVRTAWNPRIPSLAEAMEQALTPAERERFVAHLRPVVEQGRGPGAQHSAVAYLWAVKR